jgi:Tfp pilus assembly protein PilO
MSKAIGHKKKKVLGILLGTVLVIVTVHSTVIQLLGDSIAKTQAKISEAQFKLRKSEFNVSKSKQIMANLQDLEKTISRQEQSVPRGDVYLWMLKSIDQFKVRNNIELNQIEPPKPAETNTLPPLPYSMMNFTLSGHGHYQDIGFFVDDFEQTFPYVRLRSLEIEPIAYTKSSAEEQDETLQFKASFVTPTK